MNNLNNLIENDGIRNEQGPMITELINAYYDYNAELCNHWQGHYNKLVVGIKNNHKHST